MQKIIFSSLLATLLATGCVYKIDVPQGKPLTHAQASQVQIGMNVEQVRFILGTPTFTDPLQQNRWDYIYHYIPGTYAKKQKIPAVKGQHLKIYFDQNALVNRIEGLETIPQSQPGLPASKDAILTAPRL